MTPVVPIIIDGPARGKKRWVDCSTFVVEKPPKPWFNYHLDHNLDDPVPDFELVTYHIHKFIVGNMMFAIASVKSTPPSTEKALKKVFTSAALGAMIREPGIR
jgi:hypothetical protein